MAAERGHSVMVPAKREILLPNPTEGTYQSNQIQHQLKSELRFNFIINHWEGKEKKLHKPLARANDIFKADSESMGTHGAVDLEPSLQFLGYISTYRF